MERVRDYVDDIGFVYILNHQMGSFLHELGKNKMEFVIMQETDTILYAGQNTDFYRLKRDRILPDEFGKDAVHTKLYRMNFLMQEQFGREPF